jgi:hypothetical protein
VSTERRRAIVALLLLLPAPSLGTWMALVAAPGPVGSAVFAVSKAWLLLLPLAWLVAVDRRRPSFPRPSARGMPAAIVGGALIGVAIVAGWWFVGRHWIDAGAARETAERAGLGTPERYLLGALYWCTINSLLEEYVWRWFVTTRFEALLPRLAAVLASAAAFSVHHVFGLSAYFDARVTALGTLGVFIGGAFWSWLYVRYRNIWAAYVCHVFADVAVFAVGWKVLFG